MTVACEPALVFPGERVSQEEVISAMVERHADLEDLNRVVEVMRNVGVRNRWMLDGLHETLRERSFTERNRRFTEAAVTLGARAAGEALEIARLHAGDIDAMIVVSCTGYMLPGPDAYIANALGLKPTVRRLPIQQMGCAAGGTAFGVACDLLRGEPEANVLIVAVELCSLSYQPGASSLSDFISNGLFGDGAAACVVRGGDAATGLRLDGRMQHLLPDTLRVIAGDTTGDGFHFGTHPSVRRAVPRVLPDIRRFLGAHGIADPEFCVCHTGGPAILDAVETGLGLDPRLLEPSRASLASLGNVSSVVVFDVLKRLFARRDWRPQHGARGVVLAFGPGFTTEMVAATWQDTVRRRAQYTHSARAPRQQTTDRIPATVA